MTYFQEFCIEISTEGEGMQANIVHQHGWHRSPEDFETFTFIHTKVMENGAFELLLGIEINLEHFDCLVLSNHFCYSGIADDCGKTNSKEDIIHTLSGPFNSHLS